MLYLCLFLLFLAFFFSLPFLQVLFLLSFIVLSTWDLSFTLFSHFYLLYNFFFWLLFAFFYLCVYIYMYTYTFWTLAQNVSSVSSSIPIRYEINSHDSVSERREHKKDSLRYIPRIILPVPVIKHAKIDSKKIRI